MHNQLLRITALLVSIAGAAQFAAAAYGAGGDLWVLPVSNMCVAQDAKYRETPLGRRLMELWSARGDFESRPSTACFRQRRWASEGLCDDVMAIDEKMRSSKLEALYDKHREELLGMSALSDYLNDAYSPTPKLPCPESLAAAPAPAARPTGACPPPTLTDADAMRWMGTSLEKLSSQGTAYLTASVQAAQLRSETDKRKALYDVVGSTGAAAVDRLRGQGFACRFEVVNSVLPEGLIPKPADSPLYRCFAADTGSCLCKRFQITIGSGPQAPGHSTPAQYSAAVDAMVLERKNVSYTCRFE